MQPYIRNCPKCLRAKSCCEPIVRTHIQRYSYRVLQVLAPMPLQSLSTSHTSRPLKRRSEWQRALSPVLALSEESVCLHMTTSSFPIFQKAYQNGLRFIPHENPGHCRGGKGPSYLSEASTSSEELSLLPAQRHQGSGFLW